MSLTSVTIDTDIINNNNKVSYLLQIKVTLSSEFREKLAFTGLDEDSHIRLILQERNIKAGITIEAEEDSATGFSNFIHPWQILKLHVFFNKYVKIRLHFHRNQKKLVQVSICKITLHYLFVSNYFVYFLYTFFLFYKED